MTALVLWEIFEDIDFALIFPEFLSTSAKTGFAPAFTTQEAEAIKLLGVTITSSPSFTSRACKARSSASVPFASAIAYLHLAQEANSFSNFLH